MIRPFYIVWLFLYSSSMMQADVRLPAIFGSNMVLQRNRTVPVWGSAASQETVTVSIHGQQKQTIADEFGKWSVSLDAMSKGGPFELTIRGNNTIIFNNVLIGEVWICSGQSNMTFALGKTTYAKEDVASAWNTGIRLFTVKRILSDTVLNDVQGNWQESTPDVAEDFSAVAYFFGKKLFDSLHIPIGLVHVSWGGTAAEGWMPREVLESDPDFLPIIQRWQKDSANYPAAIKEFNDTLPALMAQWNKDSAIAVSLGRALPRKPTAPRGPGHRDTPCGQFNGMLHPIIPFAIRGVIWYQGEGNASRAFQYRRLFPALITTWRTLWKQGDFPFYYVQLPNLERQPEPSKSGWAELRESQLKTLAVPNTGMAVTIDAGDPKDLHPPDKRPVGDRLSRIALAKTYGKLIEYSGPQYESFRIDKNKIVLSFTHVNSGLISKEITLAGFSIAGRDKIFLPAQAIIWNNQIIVSHSKINAPVAVRYAWADNPVCNLYNKADLPASPFRTDDWPEMTFNKR
jgi:sialate O-acetylesterase